MVYSGGRCNERKRAVGPGWSELLDELDAELYAADPDYKTLQVKEKFGLLRVYLDGPFREDLYAIIGKYEQESSITCQECGGVGTIRSPGWIRVHCDPCEAAYQGKRNK